MTIKKTITGNQGVKNKSFEFKVAVNGGQGELYKVVVKKMQMHRHLQNTSQAMKQKLLIRFLIQVRLQFMD